MLCLALLAAYLLIPGSKPASPEPMLATQMAYAPSQPQVVERIIERERPSGPYCSPREREVREDADLIATHFRKSEFERLEREALARHREALVKAAAHDQAMESLISQYVTNANSSTTSKSKA
jgi:carbamoylphosphate synthase large subunit